MPYVALYIDNADIIATYATLTDAQAALNELVAKHPAVRDDVAILEVDAAGHGVGEYIYAAQHAELFA